MLGVLFTGVRKKWLPLRESNFSHVSRALTIATTASTQAPLVYRASPIDPILHPPSSSPQLQPSETPTEAIPASQDRTATTSALPGASDSDPDLSLPRLATLASLASTSSAQLRYVLLPVGFVARMSSALCRGVLTKLRLAPRALFERQF
ncbi:MAG: hypothetical protein Q9169_000906 [Polycauliona sp. 2 TL-2023]